MGSTMQWYSRALSSTTNLPQSNTARISAGCWAAQSHACTFIKQHWAANEAKALRKLFKHFPVGNLERAGRKGVRLGDFTVPNHDSVQKLPDVMILRGETTALSRNPNHCLYNAAFACCLWRLKKKVQICFITQKDACSGPGTRRYSRVS